jgi:hypothetical protein
MALVHERTAQTPRPWLTASRILLVASAGMVIHGLIGRGQPLSVARKSGRVSRI